MRFGISTLMILVFAVAVICGIVLEGSFLAFAIGFVALAILISQLLTTAGGRPIVVRDSANTADAHLLRNFLAERGVPARIEGPDLATFAGAIHPRVVVSADHAELAAKVMHDFEMRFRAEATIGTEANEPDVVDPPGHDASAGTAPAAFVTSSSIKPAATVEEIPWPADVTELFRRLAATPYALFLDSARDARTLGRYSYLTSDPFEVVRSRNERVQVSIPREGSIVTYQGDPLAVLAARLSRWTTDPIDSLPPFQGGAAGLFSYDLCHHLERLPRPRRDEFEIPDMAVGLYDWVLALDHVERRGWIISTGLPSAGATARRAWSLQRIELVKRWLAEPRSGPEGGNRPEVRLGAAPDGSALRLPLGGATPAWPTVSAGDRPALASNFSRDQYLRAVERAVEYIHAGDVYQVNLAQRLLYPLRESPVDLYLRLRERNRAPFAGYFDLGESVIASASPERFLRVQNDEVETRPIKGTRPRWPAPEADMYSGGELCESEKDRAENVMIVDLLRNDLGRVCEFGSIRVTDPLRLESYQFVHHLVSEVRGRLRPECGPIDLLRAAFPGGSVTGAPKIRAMEIIAELEPTARGPYCGSLGYIGFDGSMDTSILIRTFTCSRGWIQFPVGGGIVAQSSPEREYEETLHKAEGMIQALI